MVRLWDPATGEHRRTLTGSYRRPAWLGGLAVAFSPNGQLLASASNGDNDRALWDLATGEHRRTGYRPRRRDLDGVAFSPDGTACLAGGDKTVRLSDRHRRAPPAPSPATTAGSQRGVQPGRAAASHRQPRRDGAAMGPGHRRLGLLTGHTGKVSGVAFSRTAQLLARRRLVAGTVRLWDPATGKHAAP